MNSSVLPPYADGVTLTELELLHCQNLALALGKKNRHSRAYLAGNNSSLVKGRGMEFAEVRQYQQGDDVRTIDWRVTARTGKTHTKLFVEERERPVILLIDLSYSLYFGSSLLMQAVQAAHLGATLGWQAIQNGDKLGALIASESRHLELKPKGRRQGILQLISGLTQLHQQQLSQFSQQDTKADHMYQACQRLQRLARPGSVIWIITDGQHFNHDCLEPLTQLKRHCDIGTYLITDPLRQGTLALPNQFRLPVRDGKNEIILNRQSYLSWLNRQQTGQEEFIAMMHSIQITSRRLDAALPLTEQLALLN